MDGAGSIGILAARPKFDIHVELPLEDENNPKNF